MFLECHELGQTNQNTANMHRATEVVTLLGDSQSPLQSGMHYLAEPKQHGLGYVQSITGEHTFYLSI